MAHITEWKDYMAHCDNCHEETAASDFSSQSNHPVSIREAITFFRLQGWKVGKITLCPICVSNSSKRT